MVNATVNVGPPVASTEEIRRTRRQRFIGDPRRSYSGQWRAPADYLE
ncbi:hypothetical protein A2U01_0075230 [Trifolium medium]|uniref:Uncharacterized protein n=1 Tax=Trifolium medium TaxID=97028 RepID=A0A392SYS0_9FABA|nr:hypothetical protein [Trifolium medium]